MYCYFFLYLQTVAVILFETVLFQIHKAGTLVTEERAETGNVKWSVIFSYVRACTYLMSGLTVLFYTLTNSVAVGSNFWLVEWSNAAKRINTTNFTALTVCDHPDTLDV